MDILKIKERLSDAATFYATFIEGRLSNLLEHIKPNTTAIDIGTYIGDTAIAFASNPNIKRVIAYEPMPYSFRKAQLNVSRSPYKSKIELHNEFVSGKSGNFEVSAKQTISNESLEDNFKEGEIAVKSTTLSSILKNLRNVVIKCDAEGSEIEIFKGADLKNVYAIQIEYHGTEKLKQLTKQLNRIGFHTTYKNEHIGKIKPSRGQIGQLWAYR